MEKTGNKFLTCQIRPVMDSDVTEGRVVSRQRYVASLTNTGIDVVNLIADSVPEAFRKAAMWMESEGYDF